MVLFANTGLPMICVYWPSAWVAFIPIVIIESWVGVRLLKRPFGSCLKAAFVGNLISTLIGIPITWFVLLLIEGGLSGQAQGKLYAVTIQSPWLIPYEKYEQDLYWTVPAAAFVLSIPFYLMSVLTEAPIANWFLTGVPRQEVFRWAHWGNAASYAFLFLVIVALCSIAELGERIFPLFNPLTDFVAEVSRNCIRWLLLPAREPA
jgi:hypothetical protein